MFLDLTNVRNDLIKTKKSFSVINNHGTNLLNDVNGKKNSFLEDNFNGIMLFLYVMFTICVVENMVLYCNSYHSKCMITIIISQILVSNQNQILEFINFDASSYFKNDDLFYKLDQVGTKFLVKVISQLYLIIRLASIYNFDFEQLLSA